MKKVLVYISSEWIFDTDKDIIKYLNDEYDIHWFYFSSKCHPRVRKTEIESYARINSIRLYWCESKYKQLSPKRLASMIQLSKEILKLKPVKIIKVEQDFYWSLASKLIIKKPIIYMIHDVLVHSGTHNRIIRQIFTNLTFKMNKYFIFFSKTQSDIFKSKYANKNIFQTHMSVKDFGVPTENRPDIHNGIKLLFFGRIEYNKGLDLLISSIEKLEQTARLPISLSICGKGSYWRECEKLIKTRSLYNLQIRYIDNTEIPNLFISHHFLVLPYRDATQSGPVMIAARYGLPIFANKLDSFKEIYPEDSAVYYSSLDEGLKKIISLNQNDYNKLLEKCKKLTSNFSPSNISKGILNYISKL